jgi:hypothetical protein
VQEVSFVPHFEDITVDYDPGTTVNVTMHDGSHLRLRKLEEDYDPTNRIAAIEASERGSRKGRSADRSVLRQHESPNFIDLLNMTDEPLATLPESKVTRPGREVLEQVMEELRLFHAGEFHIPRSSGSHRHLSAAIAVVGRAPHRSGQAAGPSSAVFDGRPHRGCRDLPVAAARLLTTAGTKGHTVPASGI